MKEELKNKLFDINKFPPKEGIVIFPISMSRISNSQKGEKYLDYIDFFSGKITRGLIGATFLYTDNLYEKYNQIKSSSKHKSSSLILNHKNQFVKRMRKTTYAENAFGFTSWMQLIIEAEDFANLLSKTKKFYKKDPEFQKYVKEDIKSSGRKVTKNFIEFILEEILLSYLILKHEIEIYNKYTNGRDKWRLIAYPGKPSKSQIYFFQKNIFNRKSSNPYQNGQYDLTSKKFYNFDNIDLKTFKY